MDAAPSMAHSTRTPFGTRGPQRLIHPRHAVLLGRTTLRTCSEAYDRLDGGRSYGASSVRDDEKCVELDASRCCLGKKELVMRLEGRGVSMCIKVRARRPGSTGCWTRVVVSTSGADPKFVVMNARLNQSAAFDRCVLNTTEKSLHVTWDRQLCGRKAPQ